MLKGNAKEKSCKREARKRPNEGCKRWLNLPIIAMSRRDGERRAELWLCLHRNQNERMEMTHLAWKIKIGTYTAKFRKMDFQRTKKKIRPCWQIWKIRLQRMTPNFNCFYIRPRSNRLQKISNSDCGWIGIGVPKSYSIHQSWAMKRKELLTF